MPENPGIVLMFTPPLRPEAPAGNNTCDMYVIVVVSNSISNSGCNGHGNGNGSDRVIANCK